MQPITIKRADDGYHSEGICGTMCSATAIRKVLSEGDCSTFKLENHLPRHAYKILSQKLEESKILQTNDISGLLYYKLLCEQESGYEQYLDVSADLSDRIRNNLFAFSDFESFCDMLKTKEVTHTRISRCLLHILLNITTADMELGKALDYVPYARVLGFRKDSTELLSVIKEYSSIPLITKLADAERILDEDAYRLLKKDILTSEIYQGVVRETLRTSGEAGIAHIPVFKNEFTTPIVIM